MITFSIQPSETIETANITVISPISSAKMSVPAYHLRGVLGKDFLRCVCLANIHGEDDAVGLELGLSENRATQYTAH